MNDALDGFRSSFRYRSSYQNMMSSAVKGSPSDHFIPSRSFRTMVLPPSCNSQPLAMCGTICSTFASQYRMWSWLWRSMFCLSAGPVNAMRQLPPYLPTSSVGLSTSGSLGRRCSTGGSLPALTRSANIGASLNALGILAASRTTSGKLVLVPPAAAAAGLVVAAAAGAVVAAGAAAAGAVVAAGAAAGAVVGAAAGLAGACVGAWAAGVPGPQAESAMAAPAPPNIQTN